MIITVGNIKGGVGKSTIAANLAVLLSGVSGGKVALIDGDKQGSAAEFTNAREETKGQAGFTCVRAVGAEVRAQAKGLAETFGYVIVDAGGQDNPALRAALTISDKVLVPVRPNSFEHWSLEVMADLVTEVRETVNPDLEAYAFVNMGFPTGQDNATALAFIKEDYPAFTPILRAICQRKAFSDFAGMGVSVMEGSDVKAREEFLSVMHDAGLYHDNVVTMHG